MLDHRIRGLLLLFTVKLTGPFLWWLDSNLHSDRPLQYERQLMEKVQA